MFGCGTFIVFRRWGERPNERVITVGIGWVLLASATSGFSGYIKLLSLKLDYCNRDVYMCFVKLHTLLHTLLHTVNSKKCASIPPIMILSTLDYRGTCIIL